MRLCLSVVLVVFLCSATNGQSFLSGLVGILNRFNPFRAQQSSRPSTSSRPSSNIFRPRPTFQQPSRPESFRSQPVSAPPQFQSFRSPSNPIQSAPAVQLNPNPPQVQSFSSPLQIQNAPSQSVRQNSISAPSPTRGGNHVFQGRTFLLSWKEGQNHFSWNQARSYCSSRGMRIVSLDNPATRDHFLELIRSEGVDFMWTGGRISADKRTLTWENGRRESISRGSHPWSFTGLRGPQPDGQGTENCLAILNNLYNDGVKYHDVGCSHDKPTVCEA